LVGLLSGSGSSSSRGALPNVFLEELFFSKKNKVRAVLEKPQIIVSQKKKLWLLRRSRAKHPHISLR
jgi:hypothetical protein